MEKINRNSIKKVTLASVSGGLHLTLDALNGRKTIVAFLSNGAVKSFDGLLNEIGNNEIDAQANVEKIRKSTSDKNRYNYLKKFESDLLALGVI